MHHASERCLLRSLMPVAFLDSFARILLDFFCVRVLARYHVHLLCCKRDTLCWAGAKTRGSKLYKRTQMLFNPHRVENDCINYTPRISAARRQTCQTATFHKSSGSGLDACNVLLLRSNKCGHALGIACLCCLRRRSSEDRIVATVR